MEPMLKMRHTVESLEAHLRSVGRDMIEEGCAEEQIAARFRRIVARVDLDVEGSDPVTWMEWKW